MSVSFGIVISALGVRLTQAQDAGSIVVVGAGYSGAWDTEIVLANPFDSPLDMLVGRTPRPCLAGPCPPPFTLSIEVPAMGQASVLASQLNGTGVSYVFITPYSDGGPGLPVVRARAFAVDQPSRAMELPAISYGQFISRLRTTFVFPGAAKSSDAYSNLSVVEFGVGDVSYRIDAFDAAGNAVGTLRGGLTIGGFGVVVDVLKQMNVTAFDGQIRLTQTGGDGVLAGTLATLGSDDSFAVSGGFNP